MSVTKDAPPNTQEIEDRIDEIISDHDDEKNRRIVLDPEEVRAFLRRAKDVAEGGKLYLDSETTGKWPYHGSRIIGLSAHFRGGGWHETIYIPLRHEWVPEEPLPPKPVKRKKGRPTEEQPVLLAVEATKPPVLPGAPAPDKPFPNADVQAMWPVIQEILASDLTKVFWHQKFDIQIFWKENWTIAKPLLDLMLVAQCVYAGKFMSYQLKSFSKAAFGLRVDENTRLKAWMKKRKMKMSDGMAKVHAWLVSEYAMRDVELLAEIDARIPEAERKKVENIIHLEHKVSFEMMEMEKHGSKVDLRVIEEQIQKVKATMKEIENRVPVSSMTQDDELVQYLQSLGIELTVLTKKQERLALNDDVLEGITHPVAKDILKWRSFNIGRNYLEELHHHASTSEDGCIHSSFRQMGARTGRSSSNDPNLQQMSTNPEIGVRRAFVAPDGYDLYFFDFDQLQLRLAALLSKDENMIQAFEAGRDIHDETQKAIGTDNRTIAKNTNFAIVFGSGAETLGKTAGIPKADAEVFLARLRIAYPDVRKCYFAKKDQAEANGGWVRIASGRRRWLPITGPRNESFKAFNTSIQMLESDVAKTSLLRLARGVRALGGWVSCWVHDEFHVVLPKGTPIETVKRVVAMMEVRRGRVPLTVTPKKATPSWGEATKFKFLAQKEPPKVETPTNQPEPVIPEGFPRHFFQTSLSPAQTVPPPYDDWTLNRVEQEHAVVTAIRKDGSVMAIVGHQEDAGKAPLGAMIVSTDEARLLLAERDSANKPVAHVAREADSGVGEGKVEVYS